MKIQKPFKRETEKQLEQLFKQKPNNHLFLVFNTKPYFYFKGSEGRNTWLRRFERNVLGEPAVFVDTVFIESTKRSMNAYLQSTGFYNAEITYSVKQIGRKKANVIYYINQNTQYKIGSYDLQIADKKIYNLIKEDIHESFFRIGNGLHNITLDNEQARVVGDLRNKGYFMMSKEYVDFDVDTLHKNFYAGIGLNIHNPEEKEGHRKYFNNNIVIEIEQNSNAEMYDGKDTFTSSNFTYIPNRYELNPNVLDRNLLLFKGSEFKQSSLSRTYTRISDLGIFRFVNIQPKAYIKNDTGYVDYHMKMIPIVKYDYTIEPQMTTSDQTNAISYQSSRNFGVAAELKVMDRNVFHGAEMLQFGFRSAFEAQNGANSKGFFNTTEQRLTASLITPRAMFLPRFDRNEKFLNTRTALNLSGIYEVNFDYNRQIFSTNITYQFNKKLISYTFVPIEFSYIKSEMSDSLKKKSESDIFLQNLFSNNVILDHRFGFIYSNKAIAKGTHYYYLKWDVLEVAGTLLTQLYKLTGTSKSSNGEYTALGVRLYEYAKSAIDFRYNTIYDKNNATVFRFFAGTALPYGNTSAFAPFEKRFFVGGANDLRGWLPRSIGPGSFKKANQFDYSGEIKLEANAEFRFNIYNRWLEGAVFADAGNIWSIKADATRPNSEFNSSRFYKEIAFDAGFGVRLNFEVFIVRFDFALPLRDPSYIESERWVVKNFSTDWMFSNFTFNFGIGYPF